MRDEIVLRDNHGYEYLVRFDYTTDRDIETRERLVSAYITWVSYRTKPVDFNALKPQVVKLIWDEVLSSIDENSP